MDSGNSSSMHTCGGGGGEQDYDPRADHYHHHHHAVAGDPPMPNPSPPQPPSPPPPPQPQPQNHHQQTHLDPLISNYFNNVPFNPNLDHMLWSRQVRPEPDPQDLTSFIVTSSPPILPPQQLFFTTTCPSSDQNNNLNNNGNGNTNNMVRNPRKRSRASRRAPTTVLTTDTTNFRAMVQEFTGIPAPHFTGSSPFPRNTNSRFGLFGSSSVHNSSPPSYLLRPFAQKLIPAPFLPSSSSSSSSMRYQLPSADYQNVSNLNTQNLSSPFLNLQPSKNPFADSSVFGTKSKPLSDSSHASDQPQSMKVSTNVLDDFVHVGTNFCGSQNVASSSSSHGDALNRNENRQVNVMSYRALTSASFSEPENTVAKPRTEGTVESWICSSD